ncbi:MAG: hypothetical protein WA667_17615 [Candidatus Nitrosopolaris sp.]
MTYSLIVFSSTISAIRRRYPLPPSIEKPNKPILGATHLGYVLIDGQLYIDCVMKINPPLEFVAKKI